MSNAKLTSLAILKVNWDATKNDYIALILPFVTEALRRLDSDVVSMPDLKGKLETDFGLNIPKSFIETILRRAVQHGYAQRDRGIYLPHREKLAESTFATAEQRALRTYRSLVEKLAEFASTQISRNITYEEAESWLLSYISDFDIQLLEAVIEGGQVPDREALNVRAHYVVGAFVNHINQRDPETFDYLETMVKGHMLANVVFYPEPASIQRRFQNTTVYLDTTFLMRALGYGGRPLQSACHELLNLLYEVGAQLACFEHTLTEMRDILYSCAARIEQGSTEDAFGTLEYFHDYLLDTRPFLCYASCVGWLSRSLSLSFR